MTRVVAERLLPNRLAEDGQIGIGDRGSLVARLGPTCANLPRRATGRDARR